MQQLHTAGVIAHQVKLVIFSLRDGKSPPPFCGTQDILGNIIQQAWKEQEAIGWIDMLKGRFSWQWGKGQEYFYRNHPDTADKQTKTGLTWTIHMIHVLTDMLLMMWSNRCKCLHGHSQKDTKRIQREGFGAQVARCYQQRASIPLEHQDIFDQSLEDMQTTRNSQYLKINLFRAL